MIVPAIYVLGVGMTLSHVQQDPVQMCQFFVMGLHLGYAVLFEEQDV